MSFAATIALAALVQTGIEWAMMNNATIRTSRKVVQRSPLGPGIVVLCVRWYLSYKLSYRDLVTIMSERGIGLAHTTILRWVQHYTPEFEKRWSGYTRPVGGSWRCDETYMVLVQTGCDRAMMTECDGLLQSKHCSRDGISTARSSSCVSAGARGSN